MNSPRENRLPEKHRFSEQIQLSEPVLICYRMLRRCEREGAAMLLFFEDRIERQTLDGKKTGVLKTPKPFARDMRHILEHDPIAADAVESVQGDGLRELKLNLKLTSKMDDA